MGQIIDQSSQRGVFKGPDLAIIGNLYQKVVGQLPKPKAEEDKSDDKK